MKFEILMKANSKKFFSFSEAQSNFLSSLTAEEAAFLKTAPQDFRKDVRMILENCVVADGEFEGCYMGDSLVVDCFG